MNAALLADMLLPACSMLPSVSPPYTLDFCLD